jgi:hypothetical protein
MNHPGYETLAAVLQEAFDQAATGKGAERHANALPFHEQPMQQIARRRGLGFLLGQVDKKTEEAQGMLERGERAAWRREILGAINYLAGALIYTDGLSESGGAKETDGPVWFEEYSTPMPGREVVVWSRNGRKVCVEWGANCVLETGDRWRYVD